VGCREKWFIIKVKFRLSIVFLCSVGSLFLIAVSGIVHSVNEPWQ